MTLGEKLQKLRRQQGWTQEELAARLNISRQAISKWESDSSIPDTENVIQISKLFQVSTDYLLLDEREHDESASNASQKESAFSKKETRIMCMVIGSILSSASAIGLLIMGIKSSVSYWAIYGAAADPVKTGLAAFLQIHHLNWLFTLCIIGVFAGIFLAVLPVLPLPEDRRS